MTRELPNLEFELRLPTTDNCDYWREIWYFVTNYGPMHTQSFSCFEFIFKEGSKWNRKVWRKVLKFVLKTVWHQVEYVVFFTCFRHFLAVGLCPLVPSLQFLLNILNVTKIIHLYNYLYTHDVLWKTFSMFILNWESKKIGVQIGVVFMSHKSE